jgi:hypothetical protein
VNETRIGYVDAAKAVVATDGWIGLLGRGLVTRIIANGLQGTMFSILWKLFLDLCVKYAPENMLTNSFFFSVQVERKDKLEFGTYDCAMHALKPRTCIPGGLYYEGESQVLEIAASNT